MASTLTIFDLPYPTIKYNLSFLLILSLHPFTEWFESQILIAELFDVVFCGLKASTLICPQSIWQMVYFFMTSLATFWASSLPASQLSIYMNSCATKFSFFPSFLSILLFSSQIGKISQPPPGHVTTAHQASYTKNITIQQPHVLYHAASYLQRLALDYLQRRTKKVISTIHNSLVIFDYPQSGLVSKNTKDVG